MAVENLTYSATSIIFVRIFTRVRTTTLVRHYTARVTDHDRGIESIPRNGTYKISLGLPDAATTTTTVATATTTTHSDEDEVTGCSNNNKLARAATGIPYESRRTRTQQQQHIRTSNSTTRIE